MRWSVWKAVVTAGCGLAAVPVAAPTADAGEFFAPRIHLMNWLRPGADEEDFVAPIAPPPGELAADTEHAPMPAEAPAPARRGSSHEPPSPAASPYVPSVPAQRHTGGSETPCVGPPGGPPPWTSGPHGSPSCPCPECRRRYIDHVHYVPPPQPPPPPPPQQMLAPQGLPYQPQGMFTAPPGRGEVAGESNSIGLRGLALTLPAIRIEFPTIQFPSLVRFRRNPEMRLEEAYAPYSQGTPAVYGQLMTAQQQTLVQHTPVPQAVPQQYAPQAVPQPPAPQAAPERCPPPGWHHPAPAPPAPGCPLSREQLLHELREQQAHIEELQRLLQRQNSARPAGWTTE